MYCRLLAIKVKIYSTERPYRRGDIGLDFEAYQAEIERVISARKHGIGRGASVWQTSE